MACRLMPQMREVSLSQMATTRQAGEACSTEKPVTQ